MPIKVPNNLPAVDILTKENVFVMTDTRAMTQDIRPLQILILNLMPTKIETETQLTRLLGNTPLQVELELLQTSTHKAGNVSEEHMIAFYKTFDQIRSRYYDGMIITGAPVELMEYEEVEYWDELCEIMDWSLEHVHSIFYICWGAQAGLYHHYGIQKQLLPKKLSGVYPHTLEYKTGMLFRGFDDEFFVPHSRNTTVDEEAVFNHPDLKVISTSPEAGIFACKSNDDKHIFIMGHSEYDGDTLNKEYVRDVAAGINPEIPCNYYPEDNPEKEPMVIWRSCANLLYSNWLNYFVYQSTPFDLNAISTGETPAHELVTDSFDLITAKFGGSSLADKEMFSRVKSIIEADSRRKYIVVSAPGRRNDEDTKVTDLLISSCNEEDVNEKKRILNIVKGRYEEILSGLNQELEPQGMKIQLDLDEEFEKYMDGSIDYVSSRGEYLNARILADYIGYDFVDAKDLIHFTSDGVYDEDETEKAIVSNIQEHPRFVLPGFYGALPNGEIKTFGRGGSDVSGAILAAAANSDMYENWTDVSGLLMADPNLVQSPITVPVITYRELREMSYLGAEVMHQDAVFPVVNKGIPIRICNTYAPEDAGTLIVNNARYYDSKYEISGISGRQGYLGITVEKPGLNEDSKLREKVLKVFDEKGIKASNIVSGVDTLTLLVRKDEVVDKMGGEAGVEAALLDAIGDGHINWTRDISLIGIVGREIANSPAVAIKILSALAAMRINIKFIDHGTGNMNILLAVDDGDYETSIKAVYQQFA